MATNMYVLYHGIGSIKIYVSNVLDSSYAFNCVKNIFFRPRKYLLSVIPAALHNTQ